MEQIRNPHTLLGQGWRGAELMDDPSRWKVELPREVRDELVELAAARAGRAPALGDVAPDVSTATAQFVSRLRDMLTTGCYFAVVTGFPHEPFDVARDAYWLLGLLLGEPVPQTPAGEPIGRVEDRSAAAANRSVRYTTGIALGFHSDPADIVTMLCVRRAPAGGVSYLASARTIHDLLAAEAPDLLAELYRPLPQAAKTLREPRRPWTAIPVFGFAADDFSMRYDPDHVRAAQRVDTAPRLTAAQFKALDALHEVMSRPEIALEMTLAPGDVEMFNNAEVVHARSAYDSAPNGAGRLLLRMWLSHAGSPELPAEYRELYGATSTGTYRGGAWPDDTRSDRIGRPVAESPALLRHGPRARRPSVR